MRVHFLPRRARFNVASSFASATSGSGDSGGSGSGRMMPLKLRHLLNLPSQTGMVSILSSHYLHKKSHASSQSSEALAACLGFGRDCLQSAASLGPSPKADRGMTGCLNLQKGGHSQRKPNGIPQAELQPRAKSLAGIEQSGPSELVIYRRAFSPPTRDSLLCSVRDV